MNGGRLSVEVTVLCRDELFDIDLPSLTDEPLLIFLVTCVSSHLAPLCLLQKLVSYGREGLGQLLAPWRVHADGLVRT